MQGLRNGCSVDPSRKAIPGLANIGRFQLKIEVESSPDIIISHVLGSFDILPATNFDHLPFNETCCALSTESLPDIPGDF